MIKLSNKRMAIVQWALGYWVYVKDTNPDKNTNYGAHWYRMSDDGTIYDEENIAYDISAFSTSEEYYSSEVEKLKL